MNGKTNENVIVKKFEFNNPLIRKIDSIIDNSIRDCHDKYFHTFDHICEYDLNFTNTTNNETVIFTISDKCVGMYELTQKLAIARGNGFIFKQINKTKIKIYSNLSHINIHYHLKLGLPPLHRQFFKKISQNRDYIQNFAMIEEIHFILHVVNGIHIILHNNIVVYLHAYNYE